MVRKNARKPVSKELIPGVGSLSRSAVYSKRGIYKKKKATPAKKVVDKKTFVEKVVGGKTRKISTVPAPRFYPADDLPVPLKNRKSQLAPKLRASIVPGTVLILVAGRFRGKRVVCLSQLASGLLLVTGPFKVNGVPLRRVNSRYVIATNTKVDLSKVKIDAKFNDAYFKRPAPEKKEKGEDKFFSEDKQKPELDANRLADQKQVDAALLAVLSKTPELKKYLNASFSLTKGQYPHEMVF